MSLGSAESIWPRPRCPGRARRAWTPDGRRFPVRGPPSRRSCRRADEGFGPLEPVAVGVRPGVHDRDVAVVLAHLLETEFVAAGALAPLDLRPENLPGLSRPVSGGPWAPEAKVTPPSTPHHVRTHERDERLDVAGSERFVGLANLIHVPNGTPRCTVREKGVKRGMGSRRA
jgi:hypothetical protein